ncbi:TBC domain containing protein [Cardiosporidium cionae]|uniref:TBC domain containing protein n=1 Tax=Cardiosporidium cionae TaxID=476202 RepID=A0ABQ7J7C1_9APIC|nr:TBC domain containing protein [Cardiosporidium cionae]|eukprot:KAF8819839.1 TBC domain containing protein [Cardiosporidium cionae]
MIAEQSFWETENGSPLLNRNCSFFTEEATSQILQRAELFLDFVEEKAGGPLDVNFEHHCDDPEIKRMFVVDAERTFKSQKNRKCLCETLELIWSETKDYHQGMGFVCAFLLLLLKPSVVATIITGLHRHYVNGYFKSAAKLYVRDSRVFGKLLRKLHPSVADCVEPRVPPEAYCSKWFIGLNVHVLPFEALLLFFEAFLQKGNDFLFDFALSLVRTCENDILSAKDLSVVLAILRLDASIYPDDKAASGSEENGSFFTKIVNDAYSSVLENENLSQLRLEADEDLSFEEERRQKREAELDMDSSDEIVFSDEEDP